MNKFVCKQTLIIKEITMVEKLDQWPNQGASHNQEDCSKTCQSQQFFKNIIQSKDSRLRDPCWGKLLRLYGKAFIFKLSDFSKSSWNQSFQNPFKLGQHVDKDVFKDLPEEKKLIGFSRETLALPTSTCSNWGKIFFIVMIIMRSSYKMFISRFLMFQFQISDVPDFWCSKFQISDVPFRFLRFLSRY